jgi:hypothetical protein
MRDRDTTLTAPELQGLAAELLVAASLCQLLQEKSVGHEEEPDGRPGGAIEFFTRRRHWPTHAGDWAIPPWQTSAPIFCLTRGRQKESLVLSPQTLAHSRSCRASRECHEADAPGPG